MLTDTQKDDVRRHCGFPVFGNGITATPPAFGYRYFEWYLTIEYRMNNLSTNQELQLQNVYLTTLNMLESAIPTATTNLDTDRAAVWYHNKYEVRDRWNLYKLWCDRLIEWFGVESPSKMLSGMQQVV
jgi:hypothetical protein